MFNKHNIHSKKFNKKIFSQGVLVYWYFDIQYTGVTYVFINTVTSVTSFVEVHCNVIFEIYENI